MKKNMTDSLIDIEEMISDSVQLVQAGHLLDWNDTKNPEIIAKIKEKKRDFQYLN